jgi:hypothetical protein
MAKFIMILMLVSFEFIPSVNALQVTCESMPVGICDSFPGCFQTRDRLGFVVCSGNTQITCTANQKKPSMK